NDIVKWRLPTAYLYKINTDTVLDVERNIVGVEAVIRNHLGEVMGTTAQRLEVSYSSFLAEAVAILCGIEFAIDLGLMPVVVESDALGVVKLINSCCPNSVEICFVCKDIVSRIQYGSVTGSHFGPRKANDVTHSLAKMALSIDYDKYWS
ncbi:hypothetical protein Ddye_006262, partial [Dipteronia dyeriana]